MYTLIVSLIHLYTTSGRNASYSSGSEDRSGDGAIELRTPTTNKWYSRVPATPSPAVAVEPARHVIGDEDEDEE